MVKGDHHRGAETMKRALKRHHATRRSVKRNELVWRVNAKHSCPAHRQGLHHFMIHMVDVGHLSAEIKAWVTSTTIKQGGQLGVLQWCKG